MTELCLGTVQFGMNYGVQGNEQPDLSKAVEILNAAYNAKIRTYDTASAYGTAEVVLNAFLSQSLIKREQVRIISKTKSSDEKVHNYIFECLTELGVKYLDGYLLHDANLIFNENAVNNLIHLKETGFAKEIGASLYTPEQALKALDYDFIDIIQIPYNVLDRRLDKCNFFEKAAEIGISVYTRSVLLQGLLMMNPQTLPPNMKFAEPYVREFQNLCTKNNIGFLEGAVYFVLNHEYIDYLVFGVDNLTQLNEYISLYQNSKTIQTDDIFSSAFSEVNERVIMPNVWNSQ